MRASCCCYACQDYVTHPTVLSELFPARTAQRDCRATSKVNRVKNVRIASCTFVFTTFFTENSPYYDHPPRLSPTSSAKITRQNRPNGRERPRHLTDAASRRTWGRSRLRVGEIAPHVLAAKEFCQTTYMRRHIQLVRQGCKGDDPLALLKSQPKQPKSTTIQIRVEEEVKLRLDKYAEFIDSSAAYVITEALKLLFNKDGEFKSWLGQHAHNSEGQRHTSKAAISKGESVQLALN